MYERFYRLRERPFALTPDPDYLYPSRVHREALNYLRYGIESHAGFIVITGAIGSGKTTLLQTLLRGLDDRTTVARLMNTLLDPRELVESAMIDFGLEPGGLSKPAMLKMLGEFLVAQRGAGKLVLLVIDEAQNLSLPALEEIRMLSNLETEKSKLIQIVLIGQPDLRDKLVRPELEQLRQRITVSYHLEPLDADETAHYINHRLARAAIGAPMEFSRAVKAGASAGRVAGTVVSKAERRTKTGNRMGIVGLSDPSGQYETVIFAEGLQQYRDMLDPGSAVLLLLTAEAQGEDVRARIQSVEPLDAAAEHRGLRVFMRSDAPLDGVARRLEPKGDAEVSMILILDGGGTEVEVRLPGRFKVSPQISGAIKAVPGVVEVQAV